MERTASTLITRVWTFHHSLSDHACFDHLSREILRKAQRWSKSVLTFRCRPHSVTFGYYQLHQLIIRCFKFIDSKLSGRFGTIKILVTIWQMAGCTNYIIYFQKMVIFLYKPDEDSSGIDQSKYCSDQSLQLSF